MKILIHQNSRNPLEVISSDNEGVRLKSRTCTDAIWELALSYPEEIIGWCEESLQNEIVFENWFEIFSHDLILASFSVNTTFLPDSIGYVDQLPFIKVNKHVKYPTWLTSNDVGGIKGKVLLQFKNLFGDETNLGYLLNSVAKIGQQNGLFCYSEPMLIRAATDKKPVALASTGQLFSFVFQHYTFYWTSVLFFCLSNSQNQLPLWSWLKAFFKKNKFGLEVDLSSFSPNKFEKNDNYTLDVIIPTLDRKIYLHQVLKDLKDQSLPPKNVIIVEQDPKAGSTSNLKDIINCDWPFHIIHIFTHETGVCNARNLGLKAVRSEWIFFADDDIRIKPDLLEKVMEETNRYGVFALNLNCRQLGQETVFHKIKQWGSFGAGTSVVKSEYAQQCNFSRVFEHGFGEDADFGIQLRNIGCDIIYHPDLQTEHLKAPSGGFRMKNKAPWENEEVQPKPSPTIMAFALKHYTIEQLKGYQVSMFLKFYGGQPIKNPIKYIREMRKKWRISERWANKRIQDCAVASQ